MKMIEIKTNCPNFTRIRRKISVIPPVHFTNYDRLFFPAQYENEI